MSTVVKTVTISPPAAAAAGCTAACTGEKTDYPDGGWAIANTLTATPAASWLFVKFTWKRHLTSSGGQDETRDEESLQNPETSAANEARLDYGSLGWTEDTISDIVAVFEFVRVPTHLLVNSFSRSTPVQLVYDPSTNLLVADY